MSFYIKNKKTNELFQGFNKAGGVVWGDASNAKPFATKLLAKCQSSLLICHGYPAQRKPV